MEASWIRRCCEAPLVSVFVIISCTSSTPAASGSSDVQLAQGSREQILLGRRLVLTHDCGGCHGGFNNPAAKGWLAGLMTPTEPFHVGECTLENPAAKPCYITRARNLTPDNATGLGRFSERQIFNALRFGLRPEDTPDVEITSTIPGQGNFPVNPHYLAPPMPWPSWRHMTDQELWAIATYLKNGVKPFKNRVEESEGPPDFWVGLYARRDIGPYPVAQFPTANEQLR
jgi:mono/diheme cytochrome c family protein